MLTVVWRELGAVLVTGKVLRFDEVRGYGFIAPDDGGEDVFMHVNDLLEDKRSFTVGSLVKFRVEDGERGPKASDVSLVGSPVKTAERTFLRDGDDEGMCDVLTVAEFRAELTETLIRSAPAITAEQISRIREAVIRLAGDHGWLES